MIDDSLSENKTSKRQQGITKAVISYLIRHPNQELFVTDIVQETGFSREQVVSCLSHARNRKDIQIEMIQRGEVYRYTSLIPSGLTASKMEMSKPHRKKGMLGKMLEIIGQSKDGNLIGRDEDGTLYRLEEL